MWNRAEHPDIAKTVTPSKRNAVVAAAEAKPLEVSPPAPSPVFDSRIFARPEETRTQNVENNSAKIISSQQIRGIKIVRKETKEVVDKDIFEILKKDSNLAEIDTSTKDVKNEASKALDSSTKNEASSDTETQSTSNSKTSNNTGNGVSAELAATTAPAVEKPSGDSGSKIQAEVSKADISMDNLFDIHGGKVINKSI